MSKQLGDLITSLLYFFIRMAPSFESFRHHVGVVKVTKIKNLLRRLFQLWLPKWPLFAAKIFTRIEINEREKC